MRRLTETASEEVDHLYVGILVGMSKRWHAVDGGSVRECR